MDTVAVTAGRTVVRPYANGDEALILDLWRRALPQDPIDMDTFAQKVLADPNLERDGLLVAEVAGRPAGFLIALVRRLPMAPEGDLEPTTGWISAFGVDPALRRQGVATALFDAGEGYVRRSGRRRVEVSPYAPGYFWPGPDRDRHAAAQSLLRARGYRALYEAVAMDRSLVGFEIPEDVRALQGALEAEGYRFGPLTPRHALALVEFNAREFYPDWVRAARDPVARRIAWDHVLVCVKDDRVVGYAQFGAYDHVPDRFGPFGVDSALRGKGIGKVLLYLTMEALQRQGFHDTWFLWTGEASPAGHLYLRAGFAVTRRFDVFAKDL
jgi:mycothiol synthase